ncbi:MAG: Fic family protein [Thermoguttaceae bacterium]
MRKPSPPPEFGELLANAAQADRLAKIHNAVTTPLVQGKYLSWGELQYHTPPTGLSLEEWWLGLKLQRASTQPIPLQAGSGLPFKYLQVDPIPEQLHEMDLGAGGDIQMPDPIVNPQLRDRYYVSSLIEEAITSSQLEGAVTTRVIAEDMLRSGRTPNDRSEKMIFNNFITMRRIGELKDEPLTRDLVLEIHRLITEGTLDDPTATGRFRRAEENIVVGDMYGEIYHQPPPASQLDHRMRAMCDFANGKTPGGFVHPVLRSILLHFWLAYDHPFVDGNGRTARSLFYWSMLRHRYWLCEFLSISPLILKAPSRYQLAFLHTEIDDNDLTYFILYHLDLLHRALRQLHEYLHRKSEQARKMEISLQGLAALNHRQRALMSHAIRHPHQIYTVESHQTSHKVVYETARKDLLDLAQRGLLVAKKHKKTWHFTPAADLESRLSHRP